MFCRTNTTFAFWLRDADLMSPLRRDADLALLIVAFVLRHLRSADSISLAFWHRDVGLMSLRRDVDLAWLNIAPMG